MKKALTLIKQAETEDSSNAQIFALEGDIYYNLQNLSQAKLCWEKTLKLNPGLKTIEEKLKSLKSETPIEENLSEDKTEIFEFRSESAILNSEARQTLKASLKNAYQTIGRDFNYFPKHKIIVLLYSPEGFAKVRSVPAWAGGLFDGKIRIPLYPDTLSQKNLLEAIIWHEYTHSLIFDLTGGNCPVFLNEGLAVYEEERINPTDKTKLIDAAAQKNIFPLITYFSAPARDSNLSIDAGLFYLESGSIVRYIISIWGWEGMRVLLVNIGEGRPWPDSIQKALNIAPQTLEIHWLEQLK
ncbi:MAG: peptidase MA family metallohydrolase [Candidatus Omnitrophica bacterium]|nr:peptidase MA family metallohydrolase [Candidatus Omnitrophota bacterium]